MDISIHFITSVLLMVIGLYTIIVKKDLIKIIIGVAILSHGVNLFFISGAYSFYGTAPIITTGEVPHINYVAQVPVADPLPQALIITAIVVALAVTALMAATALRIYQYYGTFNLEKIKELRE